MKDEELIIWGIFGLNLVSDESVVDEDGELLKLMEDESVLVMGGFRSISISDETVVDINVELADSGEGADVSKPFFFMKMPTVPPHFDDAIELPDLTDS